MLAYANLCRERRGEQLVDLVDCVASSLASLFDAKALRALMDRALTYQGGKLGGEHANGDAAGIEEVRQQIMRENPWLADPERRQYMVEKYGTRFGKLAMLQRK